MASINNDPDAAIAHGEKAYKMNPSNELISNALGLAFYKKSKALAQKGMEAESQGYNARAIELYAQALAREPRYAAAHINMGISLGHKEDYDGAIEHFQYALRLNPSKPFVTKNIDLMLELKAMTHPLELETRDER